MRTTRGLTMFAMFSIALAIAAVDFTARGDGDGDRLPAQPAKGAKDEFIVHEWGTFTSFSGSDSVKLEFRPLVDADLPGFVLNRGRQAGTLNPLLKVDTRVLQRMETPVTYFYSDRERQATVRVGFPQGLLTEFYPPVEHQLPEFKWFGAEPLSGAMLDWGKVTIVPEHLLQIGIGDPTLSAQVRGRVLGKLLPPSGAHEHYAYARETDSALVYVERQADKKRPLAPRGAYFEKFLFYRGVGNFELPLRLSAETGGRFELVNTSEHPIRSLFLVTVEGESVRFLKVNELGANERLNLNQSTTESSAEELGNAVVAALIDERLYEKEARAMVKTWQSSWFGEDGTRLFYLLPQSITEELLPLQIEPTPDELVRVMVGRLEIMRPEDEARVVSIVQQSAKDRVLAQRPRKKSAGSKKFELPEDVIRLGRLAEPALVRVKTISPDAETRKEAVLLLEQLQNDRKSRIPADGAFLNGLGELGVEVESP